MRKHASRLYSTGLVALLIMMAMVGAGAAQFAGGAPQMDYYSDDWNIDDYQSDAGNKGALMGNFPNIDPQMVLDEENIKINLLSLDYSSYEYVLINYEVESLYDTAVTVQMWEFSINGYMIEASCSSDVAPGEKIQDVIYIEQADLDLAGIGEIADMQMQFTVFDTNTYDDIFISDYIPVKTDSSYVQSYDDSGIVLYDDRGVKVVMKPLDFSDSLTGPRIPLYLENNTDEPMDFHTSDLMINGNLIDDFFIMTLSPGMKMTAFIEYFETPKRQYGIEEFEEIEFEMYISGTRNYDIFFSTGTLYVDLREN